MSVNDEIPVSERRDTRKNLLIQAATRAPEATMLIVLDALKELVDYELAVVLDYDGKDTLTVHTAAGPLSGPRLGRFSLSLARRPDIAKLMTEGKPHLFERDERHLDTYAEILDLPDGHSCLVTPLSLNDRTIGLLTLDHRSCGVFSRNILNFIGVISRLIAVSLSESEKSRALQDDNRRLLEERNRLLAHEGEAFRNLAGTSPAWSEVLDLIKLVAATDSPVLLRGETGTGKEEAARAIHRLSDRSSGPFIALNCSALPETIVESELFGHEKGSFTGAEALRKGRFELAHGGTLFLDEVGDLPRTIQPKILRTLQEGTFERVGGERTIKVDVRIIAATHVELDGAAAAGSFREDLLYRISVFPISLPPLRERGQDVILLAELFASRLRERRHWENLSFNDDALDHLLSREWPGNVRELRNAIERAAILARGGLITSRELMKGDRMSAAGRTVRNVRQGAGTASGQASGSKTLIDVERAHIGEVLAACSGKIYGKDGAAAVLGLKPTTLQSRLKKLGIR